MNMRMGDAYRMRERHKEMQRRESAVNPLTGENFDIGEYDRSLQTILADEREQNLFLQFIGQKNARMAQDIAKRRAEKKVLTEAEEALLEESREEFNITRAESARLREELTADRLKHISLSDKDLDEIVGQVGADSAARFLSDEIEELAVTKPDVFRRIVTSMRAAVEIESSGTARWNEAFIKDSLEHYGVTREMYEKATKTGLTMETHENLKLAVRRELGGLRSAINWITFNSIGRRGAKKLYQGLAQRTHLLDEVDSHMVSVIRVLRSTLKDDVRLAIQNQAFQGDVGEAVDYNVLTLSDYKRAIEELKPEARGTRFKQELDQMVRTTKKLGGGRNRKTTWAALDPAEKSTLSAERDKTIDKFVKKELDLQKSFKPRGSLLEKLIQSLLSGAKESDLRTQANTLAS